jgi:riboflavin biosynthesis pyrimidine reductase
LPEPGAVEVPDVLASLRERPPPADRPYLAVNFVLAVDGHATVDGRSGELGDDGDRAMFHGLRQQADAILAGTNTVRLERYGRLIARPERRERRVAAGLDPEPLAILITRSGRLPEDLPLLDEPEARVVIISPEPPPDPGWRAQVQHVAPAQPTLTAALRELRRRFEVRTLLCEGGPALFTSLLAENLVDELFLTLAPKLVGGVGPAITNGPPLDAPLELRWLLERNGALYARYAVGH